MQNKFFLCVYALLVVDTIVRDFELSITLSFYKKNKSHLIKMIGRFYYYSAIINHMYELSAKSIFLLTCAFALLYLLMFMSANGIN